jgi:hypothetical protein
MQRIGWRIHIVPVVLIDRDVIFGNLTATELAAAIAGRLQEKGKTFLSKMIVVREYLGDAVLAHGFHRDAVGEAVLLVGAGFVKG